MFINHGIPFVTQENVPIAYGLVNFVLLYRLHFLLFMEELKVCRHRFFGCIRINDSLFFPLCSTLFLFTTFTVICPWLLSIINFYRLLFEFLRFFLLFFLRWLHRISRCFCLVIFLLLATNDYNSLLRGHIVIPLLGLAFLLVFG